MDIYFTYESAVCDQYMVIDEGDKVTITKVVEPLRVEGTGTERMRLISGCNFYKLCRNLGCNWSQASREQTRIKTKIPK